MQNSDGSTQIARLFQQGCAKIRVPRSSSPALEAVMINSSGGMTGGDQLNWNFELGEATTATLTTQACERVYRSTGDAARTDITLKAAENASLAWLPQETIMFDGGRFSRTLTVDLAATSTALVIESTIFGRRAMGEQVQHGAYRDSWKIRQDGRLLHAEEFALKDNIAGQLCNRLVTGEHEAISTILLVSPRAEGLLPDVRELLQEVGAASCWNGKLLARLTAKDGYTLRKKLILLINVLNQGATLPKIWSL